MSYLQKAKDLQALVAEGKSFEALDKYYADHVTLMEADGTSRQGKEAQRKAIQEWYDDMQEMHGSGIGAITADEENAVTTAETWVDFTNKQGHRIQMEEVAVQKWEGDHIVHERFYYFVPAAMQQWQG